MPDTPDEELVRRLLADARHDEPLPADVAARLDGVLDHLATEHPATEHPADDRVTVLAPARRRADVRRRRRWATALAAAAAVVVGGVTLHEMWPSGSGMSDSAGSASESGGRSAGDSGSKAAPGDSLGSTSTDVDDLHRATLRADVRRAVERLRTPLADLTPAPGSTPVPFTCAPADWGPGTAHPVRLDGEDAMLVLRPPAEARQVADVLECGTARRLASVTLPAR